VSFLLVLISNGVKVLHMVAKSNPKIILDIATGTGDLAILMAQTKEKKIGLDISAGMLEVGVKENC
jgi:demethylmenaquinone methyltransferase/2-methoxy-6-polyprenyl-1,4-benzoquinol methylase